jgi:hypothetical protein
MTAEQFMQSLVTAVKDLSLFFAGQPDERVSAALDKMRRNVGDQFIKLFPDNLEMSTTLLDNMVDAIQTRRREIEGGTTAMGLLP